VDNSRRKFLKIILIGSGIFLADKVFSPLSRLLDTSFTKTDVFSKISPRDFRIIENKKGLSVYDSSGEEIFQIDKEV